MRPLVLHVSALNDAEYVLYTAALTDLALPNGEGSSIDHGTLSVGVREARAWLRGRYSGVPAGGIDSVLKLFRPDLGPKDALTGGQFFAALRLVIHLESGKALDSGLAFVQAHPADANLTSSISPRQRGPSRHSHLSHHTRPPASTSQNETNPFAHAAPLVTASSSSSAVQPSGTATNDRRNPFLFRAKSLNLPHSPSSNSTEEKVTPPLPPRKTSIIPPPRHGISMAAPKAPDSSARGQTSHQMSPLIQQSLQASKAGQSLKKAEELLEKETVMQVLKSSLPITGKPKDVASAGTEERPFPGSNQSSSLPPPPRRRKPTPSDSQSSDSLQSFDQVAGAHLPSLSSKRRLSSSHSSPAKPTFDTLTGPPTHPNRRSLEDSIEDEASTSSPPSRVHRSHSLHHPAPPPRPPPRHRRPESVQLPHSDSLSASRAPDDPHLSPHPDAQPPRHSTLSRSLHPPSPSKDQIPALSISQLQKTFEKLQTRAQPTLDKARYKAEAGLSRRGFVKAGHEGQQGLMDDADCDGDSNDPSSNEGTKLGLWKDRNGIDYGHRCGNEQGWKPL